MDGRLYAYRGGRLYDLTTLGGIASPRDIDGMGLPGVNRVAEHGPLQHGVTDVGFRLQPRNLSMVLVFKPHCFRDSRRKRQEFMEIFKPGNDAVQLQWRFPDGVKRQVDCHFTGGLSMPTREMTNSPGNVSIRAALTLYAPDPTWYDPVLRTVTFDTAVIGGLIFPITFPIVFGTETIGVVAQVTYGGTWPTFPIITLTGPMENPQVSNLTTDEQIKLDYNIAVDESVTIDLRYGYKTIYNNFGTNLLYALADGSDLATFHLAPDPEAPGGVNELFADGDGLAASSGVMLQWYDRFIGV